MVSLPGPLEGLLQRKSKISEIVIDGQRLAVTLRRNSRARRLILRLSKDGTGIVLTIPPGTSDQKAMAFAASEAVWISRQLKKLPPLATLSAGMTIPLRGVDHKIIQSSEHRTPVWTEAVEGCQPMICVSGQPAHLPRRLVDWLKGEARKDLTRAARFYAVKMAVKVRRISIRDTTSRWGSCSAAGNLSFSWRLILAPPHVLDYVAAHEVAHLLEMNHSPRFWDLLEEHCPQTNKARSWLRRNGAKLHGYKA